MAGDYVSEF